jgi:hypothetical protein
MKTKSRALVINSCDECPNIRVDFELYGYTVEDWGKNDDLSCEDCLTCSAKSGLKIKRRNKHKVSKHCPLMKIKFKK